MVTPRAGGRVRSQRRADGPVRSGWPSEIVARFLQYSPVYPESLCGIRSTAFTNGLLPNPLSNSVGLWLFKFQL
jgi:hypothetical protein